MKKNLETPTAIFTTATSDEVSNERLGAAFRTLLASLSKEQCMSLLEQIKGFLSDKCREEVSQ